MENNKHSKEAAKQLLQEEISYIEADLRRDLSNLQSIVARAERIQTNHPHWDMFKDFVGVNAVMELEVENVVSVLGKHVHTLKTLKLIQKRLEENK